MKLFGRDLDREVAVIAEIGVNHEGDVEAASRLLRLAAESGADAAKFQSYTPSRFIAADDAERRARVARFGLDEAAHRRLAREADDLGIAFFSSAITEDWVPLIAELAPAIKIASGDLTFEPVIRAAAATGRIVLLSTGLGTTEEVDRAVSWIAAETGDAVLADRLALLHCVSAYPTPLEDASLLAIPYLAQRYGLPTGYSNHVEGLEAPLAAIALGAQVVEVHFTDRREGRAFRDHSLSLDPPMLERFTGLAQAMRAARGRLGKTVQPSEAPGILAVRKGLVAARDLPAGTVIAVGDLAFARPATEFAAAELPGVLGRRLAVAVDEGHVLRRDAVEPS